ncbi:hypothetical protein JCM3770_004143 [Rhodotorula araucariae]
MLRLAAATLLLAATAIAPPALSSDLTPRYDHSAIGVPVSPAEALEQLQGGAKRYVSLIALHGVLGFLAWQVVAPLAVCVAAVGKSWGTLWFRAHWRMQMYFVAPATIVSLIAAAIANADQQPASGLDRKHKIAGYVILGALAVQALFGFYSHDRQAKVERFAAENGRSVPEPKRRASNWIHMALGIGLLTLAGLEVTWGIAEFEEKASVPVPTWVVVIHWVVAGLPVLVITPFVVIRGILRLRHGASFTEAFFTPFHSSSSSLTTRASQTPRKLFLNSSTYISTPVFDVDFESEKPDTASAVRHTYSHGGGADGRQRGDSVASSWPGAETREEYEAEVASSRAPESVVGSEAASIASWTTAAREYPRGEGDTAEKVTLLSAASAMGSVDEPYRAAGPSQLGSSPAPVPATYPPAPVVTRNVVSTTPSLPPLPAIFSPVSLPATAAPMTAALPSTAAATASPLSPRLSFMPFPGPAPVHPPPPPAPPSSVGSSPAPTLRSAGTTTTARVVPAPAPVPAPTAAVEAGAPLLARHESLAAQVVDAPLPPRTGGRGGEGAGALLLPLPGEPDSPPLSSAPDAREEDEEGEDADVRDESESSRLMDELERELTISTVRSGRSGRGIAGAHAEAEAEAEAEQEKHAEEQRTGEEAKERTPLEREQSGKWFGSNRFSSPSSPSS